MSSDGTSKPPSFAPTGASGPQRASVRTKDREAAPPQDQGGTRAEATPDGNGVATPAEPTGTAQEVRGARPSPVVPGGRPEAGAQRTATALPRPAGEEARTGRRPATAERPGAAQREERAEQASVGPRRVRLALARVDPWSVMKLAFLLSFAVGIMIVVAAAVVWTTIDSMGIFAEVNQTIAEIAGTPDFFDLEEYVAFDRVLALSTIIAIVDVVLLTALATLFAFLYNVVASLVGGIHVTLTDD